MIRNYALLTLTLSILMLMTACQSANHSVNHNQTEAAIANNDTVPVTKANLADSAWRLVDLAGEKATTVEQTLSVAADNKVSGKGGCNSYFGRYDVLAGELSIGPLGATKKLCERTVMGAENRFFDALRSALNATLVGENELLIYCRNFAQPLRFRRV